jgi:5'-nucleotidase
VDKLGPVITRMDLMGCFPFDDSLTRVIVTGEQLARMFAHWMRTENRSGEGECYQVNSAVRAAYDDAGGSPAAPSPDARLAELAVRAIPIVREGSIVTDSLEIPGVCEAGQALIPAEQHFTVTLQGYHLSNMSLYLDVTLDEVAALGEPKVVTTSAQAILEEWLANNQNVGRRVEGRLVYR